CTRSAYHALSALSEELGFVFGKVPRSFSWAFVMIPANAAIVPALACDEILRIAQRDAVAAFGDLSGYRISLVQAPDGWHVDYDLVKRVVAGGGPHYVIDPVTGAILSKVYEQ